VDSSAKQKPSDRGNPVVEAKNVNANVNKTVTVSGKNVKFSARSAKEALAV
jgi:hypothetical protein